MIIDAQVHAWLPKDTPNYPWAEGHPTTFFETQVRPHAIETIVEEMKAAGVDAALLVTPSLYGWDNRYTLESTRKYPRMFRAIARIDWRAPDHKRRLENLMRDAMIRGIRITERHNMRAWAADGDTEPMLAAAEEIGVPVCGSPGPLNLPVWGKVAARHPSLTLVLDHLGMEAPPTTVPWPPVEPFKTLPELLALAAFPNIVVKMTANAALAHEPYPFRDIWPALKQIVAAFGAERIMWGTDYNRTKTLHAYREAVRYIDAIDGFDQKTKELLYRGTLQRVFRWTPDAAPHAAVERSQDA